MKSITRPSRYMFGSKARIMHICACLILLIGWLVAGCSRTVVGGFLDSPDEKYRVYVRTYGAYGHRFVDETAKVLRVTIVRNDGSGTILFKKEYRIRGSDIVANTAWDQRGNVVVILYDYGSGVVRSEGREKSYRTNYLRTIVCRFEPQRSTFADQPST